MTDTLIGVIVIVFALAIALQAYAGKRKQGHRRVLGDVGPRRTWTDRDEALARKMLELHDEGKL